jgi:glucarate dehydratase
MRSTRRTWIAKNLGGSLGLLGTQALAAETAQENPSSRSTELKITSLRVTPIALPDPPILASSGCHGPYFLRNIVELETNAGITGIGETHGGENVSTALVKGRGVIVGQSAFAYRKFAGELMKLGASAYAGIELACLDVIGKATGRRLCELLGGPVREKVEFGSYLFFRYAADHPRVLDDPHLADGRGRGDKALDQWGEVRTPEAMAEMAWRFHQKWGFRVHKLKGGVLPPDVELETMRALNARFQGKHPLRIDPNAVWTMNTALRIGEKLKELPLEYYEDPVSGQQAMGEVREKTKLRMSTNMCVTRFSHIPEAIRTKPIDVVLCDHHGWGGITACQALGTMAQPLGWALSQHSNNHAGITMAAMIHVGALVPQLTYASDTHYPWLVDGADIIQGPKLKIEGGFMEVPKAAGLGVELDRDKLSKAHEVYQKCGMRRRDDATTMRRFEPGWQRTML